MTTVERIADEFVGPLREAQRQLADLNAEIAVKRKELAAIESQCAVSAKALSDKSDELVAVTAAVNAKKAELVHTQTAHAAAEGAYDDTKRKIQKLVGAA